MRLKKIFVDIYLQYNLGDDLFLDILATNFKNVKFTINYLGTGYDKFISNYSNISRRKYTFFNKVAQHLNLADTVTNYGKIAEEHDALLFIGGSIFREEDYHEHLLQDRMNMINEFKSRGKSVFIIGSNFGPYKSEEFYNDYNKLFELCDDVCFRDKYSYDLFKNLPQVRYAPDIVFQMSMNEYKVISPKNIIGFSLIDLEHKQGLSTYSEAYINSTVNAIELFIQRGYDCCLMSFCEKEGDYNVIKKIMSLLSSNSLSRISIYRYQGNLKEAISLIASFKLFIAARFHANILALLLGVKVMPIIYSNKTINMYNDMNQTELLIHMNKIESMYDESTILTAFNNKVNIETCIKESKNQFQVMNKIINNSKKQRGVI